MFVAGIELFFGFVVGAILLVLGLRILFWMLPKLRYAVVFTVVFIREIIRGIFSFLWRNISWVAGILAYCFIAAKLGESESAVALEISAIMYTALVISFFIWLYVVTRRAGVRAREREMQ